MNKLSVLLFFLCVSQISFAQTMIGGVVNQYAAIVDIQSTNCQNVLTLDDATAFEAGDKVVIIQMQGAEINENNNNSFGTVANLNGAGWYEINQVAQVNGNEINLSFQLIHNFNVSGNVQLIKMPVYEDAYIDQTLTADPWNGATGGVLAIEVSGQLNMNADIDVSGLGFRGGTIQANNANDCNWLFQQNDYWYNISDWRGAAKGEGIATYISGKEHGRGPQANGGGGGNDHNSGGGGGANVTVGGMGGENDEPSTFGCNGTYPGLGGIALPNNFTDQIFLGGGGGAGHENNEVATNGGNGGGIVILIINDLVPNDFIIRANGQTPVDGGGDGAGGGGAGGTVLLNTQNVASMITIQAIGGHGGLVDNAGVNRCHGPGGGGGGGRVLTNLVSPPDMIAVDLSPGIAGISINSSACEDGSNGATGGEYGHTTYNAGLIVASNTFDLPIANFGNFPVIVNTVDFINQSINALTFAWDFGDGGMSDLINPTHTYAEGGIYDVQLVVTNECGADTITQTIEIMIPSDAPTAAFSQSASFGCAPFMLSFFDESVGEVDTYSWTFPGGTPSTSSEMNPQVTYANSGFYNVGLTVTGPGGADEIILENAVEIGIPPQAAFTYTIDNGQVSFQNASTGFDNVSWVFGDGAMDDNPNPLHIYTDSGLYTVELTVSNECGADVVTETIEIDLLNPLSASFTLDDGSGCTPHFVNFEDLSVGEVTSYNWTFAGGQPLTSTAPNPEVLYEVPGIYTVQLEISGPSGSDIIIYENLIEVVSPPDALFGYNINDNVVSFVNVSTNATSFQWSFGDGTAASSEESPVHEFTTPGVFDVTLIATNDYCGNAITESIYLDFVNVDELNQASIFHIFPNPANEWLIVSSEQEGDYSLRILSLNGVPFSRLDRRFSSEVQVDIASLASGVYIIEIEKEEEKLYKRLVKF